jgi:glycyl-tRNA synthetase
MYDYPTLGYEEIEGIASRSDYDLGSHSRDQENLNISAKVSVNRDSVAKLNYYDQPNNRHVVPYVIEPSAGVGRCFLAVLSEAYDEQMVKEPAADKLEAVQAALDTYKKSVSRSEKLSAEQRDAIIGQADTIAAELSVRLPQIESMLALPGADSIEVGKKLRGVTQPVVDEFYRTVLHLKPHLAPVKVAVFPLKRNHDGLVSMAKGIRTDLQINADMRTVYDDTGAIGKLYRRQDEIGTPFCVTVDFQSLEDQTVTIRDRDTMQQERIKSSELEQYVRERSR